jgi:hypothetical protein
MKGLLVFASLTLATAAMAEKFDRANNPTYFNLVAKSPIVLKFSELPLKSKLRDERMGWSENYWRSDYGGVAYRWNDPGTRWASVMENGKEKKVPLRYKILTKDEVMKMSEADLEKLSAAELYDIATGDYNFTLTKKILSMNSPNDLWWEGICHGWSLAASNYPEPDKVLVTNKDGIQVPFGSSDVKGLLSLHDAYNSKGLYTRIGARCSAWGKVEGEAFEEDGDVGTPNAKQANAPACRDVNAGAFHAVLASMIGINSQGFVADIDRFNDVWNQPIKAYDSTILGSEEVSAQDIKNGIAQKVRVKTEMTYGDELEFYSDELAAEYAKKGEHTGWVSKEPVTGTDMQTDGVRNYEYVLELDKNGVIIGGEWISESRPDMLWMKRKDDKFRNGKFNLEGLNKIYKPREI